MPGAKKRRKNLGCTDTPLTVSNDEAWAILEVYFTAVQEKFFEICARTRTVRLEIDDAIHDTPRHFAAWDIDRKVIVASPRMVELPRENVAAIFAHEFGHAVDYLYPGEYALQDGELVKMPAVPAGELDKRATQAVDARIRWWKNRDDDTIERTADAIGEYVIEKPIGYSGPCLIQGFGGMPRPEGLR